MKFRFREFVSLARELFVDLDKKVKVDKSLVQLDTSQAILRTIISRSYYGAFQAVFHFTRDVENDVQTIDHSGSGTGPYKHEYIANKYMNAKGDRDRRLIGQKLKDLRIRRNKADYDGAPTFSIEEVGITLREAEFVLERLEGISKSTSQ